jgi:hypothetical protein
VSERACRRHWDPRRRGNAVEAAAAANSAATEGTRERALSPVMGEPVST